MAARRLYFQPLKIKYLYPVIYEQFLNAMEKVERLIHKNPVKYSQLLPNDILQLTEHLKRKKRKGRMNTGAGPVFHATFIIAREQYPKAEDFAEAEDFVEVRDIIGAIIDIRREITGNLREKRPKSPQPF